MQNVQCYSDFAIRTRIILIQTKIFISKFVKNALICKLISFLQTVLQHNDRKFTLVKGKHGARKVKQNFCQR